MFYLLLFKNLPAGRGLRDYYEQNWTNFNLRYIILHTFWLSFYFLSGNYASMVGLEPGLAGKTFIVQVSKTKLHVAVWLIPSPVPIASSLLRKTTSN